MLVRYMPNIDVWGEEVSKSYFISSFGRRNSSPIPGWECALATSSMIVRCFLKQLTPKEHFPVRLGTQTPSINLGCLRAQWRCLHKEPDLQRFSILMSRIRGRLAMSTCIGAGGCPYLSNYFPVNTSFEVSGVAIFSKSTHFLWAHWHSPIFLHMAER